MVLVGTCPGGTSSNVITYLSKGDTALSIGMTSINTLLAPFLTPLLTYLYLRTSVDVDISSMFMSIIQVVIIPIGLGLIINRLVPGLIEKGEMYSAAVEIRLYSPNGGNGSGLSELAGEMLAGLKTADTAGIVSDASVSSIEFDTELNTIFRRIGFRMEFCLCEEGSV